MRVRAWVGKLSIPEYQRPPSFIFERLTIAIMCGETMQLHWQDETSERSFLEAVKPRELREADGADYLVVEDPQGQMHSIRIDLIRNLPRPVK